MGGVEHREGSGAMHWNGGWNMGKGVEHFIIYHHLFIIHFCYHSFSLHAIS